MRLVDMEVGQTVTRDTGYTVTKISSKTWEYDYGIRVEGSVVWEYTDYRLIKQKENKIKTNVNYIGGEYNIAEVSYDLVEGIVLDTYYFKVDKDITLQQDDLVVVESKKGLGIARIVGVFENNIKNADIVKRATAWVVDKVDYSRQQARKEATEKREYILQQLEEKKEQMETIKMYAMLAEMDPEAKKLVDELKTLGV